jgi:hypothetical protein
MSDEWRIRIEVEPERAQALLRSIEDASPSEFVGGPGARFPVTHAGDHVFIYADSESAAHHALAELAPILAEHGLGSAVTLWRWHPVEERWEDAALPLPRDAAEREREHERREADEAERSRESGFAEWEVRITLPSHHEARELADRLRDEGIPVTRGWRHVMAGAVNEDEARSLAQRLKAEAPADSALEVEPSGTATWRSTNPFAVFGGLGG